MAENIIRLDVRVPIALRRLIRQAAAKSDQPASQWIREVLEREATRVLKEPEP
jgi:uncharacterized protein (DUF1778 family)